MSENERKEGEGGGKSYVPSLSRTPEGTGRKRVKEKNRRNLGGVGH